MIFFNLELKMVCILLLSKSNWTIWHRLILQMYLKLLRTSFRNPSFKINWKLYNPYYFHSYPWHSLSSSMNKQSIALRYSGRLCLFDSKGQIISKGLFGILEFSQKTNERICHSSKNECVRLFFGRIRGYQKFFRNYLTFNT